MISVSKDRFNFNTVLVRIAQISPQHKVVVHVDPPCFRVGFEFVTTDEPDALALIGAKKGKSHIGLACSARGIGVQFPWVAKVGNLPHKKDRHFSPKREEGLWVIQLCPAFEISCDRSDNNIPGDAVGIYRYMDEKKEVAYIGRGNIKGRLNSPERADWKFDTIEFSIVEDGDDRERWEAYWINRYKEQHGGRLPYYNVVSGTSKTSDAQQDVGDDDEQ